MNYSSELEEYKESKTWSWNSTGDIHISTIAIGDNGYSDIVSRYNTKTKTRSVFSAPYSWGMRKSEFKERITILK